MPLDRNTLSGFYGTSQYYRYSALFRRHLLTDGTKYVAENGGNNGAYWLMDAICSYHSQAMKNPRLQEHQFWKLEVKDGKGVLTCREDSGLKPVFTQKFDTDFDLPEIEIWVAPSGDEKGIVWIMYLPSEH